MDECLQGYPHNFCFIHNTFAPDALASILKDGYIKKGTEVQTKYRRLGGEEGSDKVYGQIYFDDLKNTYPWGVGSVIIDKKVLCHMDVEFHRGWQSLPIKEEHKIKTTDTSAIIKRKLKSIRNYLKNPRELPKGLRTPLLNHEIMFDKNISVRRYVVGVVCSDEKTIKKLQNVIKKNGYKIWLKTYADSVNLTH